MINNLMLPEEDSVSFKEIVTCKTCKIQDAKNKIVIVVVDFPHISNFTDLDSLKREKDVLLRIVRKEKEIPDQWDNMKHRDRAEVSGLLLYNLKISHPVSLCLYKMLF